MRCRGEPVQLPEPRSSWLQLQGRGGERRGEERERSWARKQAAPGETAASAGALAWRSEGGPEGLETETPQPTPTFQMQTDVVRPLYLGGGLRAPPPLSYLTQSPLARLPRGEGSPEPHARLKTQAPLCDPLCCLERASGPKASKEWISWDFISPIP